MRNFSIHELQKFSGIKAHTIRCWEQRYNFLQPSRSDGNIRRYSLNDVEKLLQVSFLYGNGYKISKLAAMQDDERTSYIEAVSDEIEQQAWMISRLIITAYRLEISSFENVLEKCFEVWPPQTAMKKILYPFLQKMDLLFQGKKLLEEHLIVGEIRKRLLWSIAGLSDIKDNERTIVLFLNGTRQLDILLLLFCYFLKNAGWRVIYLGDDVTPANLKQYLQTNNAQYLLTYLNKSNADFCLALNEALQEKMEESPLLVIDSGVMLPHGNLPNVHCMKIDEALQLLLAPNTVA